jgi:toxin ParE1/3/4
MLGLRREKSNYSDRLLGRSTVDRSELAAGVRSFHIRHSRNESREAAVGDPVHVIFYRALNAYLIEIVRVLHERMEPGRHMRSSG